MGRHFGHALLGDLFDIGDVIPAETDCPGKHQGEDQDRYGWNSAVIDGRWKAQFALRRETRRFDAELVDQSVAVEAEEPGIAAQKTDRVGRARQRIEAARLDRLEMLLADVQLVGDGGKIDAEREPRLGQLGRDRAFAAIVTVGPDGVQHRPAPARRASRALFGNRHRYRSFMSCRCDLRAEVAALVVTVVNHNMQAVAGKRIEIGQIFAARTLGGVLSAVSPATGPIQSASRP